MACRNVGSPVVGAERAILRRHDHVEAPPRSLLISPRFASRLGLIRGGLLYVQSAERNSDRCEVILPRRRSDVLSARWLYWMHT